VIGQTHAKHTVDHDAIFVQGPFDNFRRIKIKVADSPLTIYRMVVTYDNGAPDRIDVRQNIAKGGREPGDRPARHRQGQRPQDRVLVRDEGHPQRACRRHNLRDEVRLIGSIES
jgi:hypothetical protein